jgi:RNA polymerase sigma factor (sigma-70 family)
MAGGLDPSIPTRQSLIARLKDWRDSASWRDFFDTYWKLIYGVARKAGLSDAEAQDVVQDTIIGVAKKIPDFHYDPAVGSFKSWLMQLTRWRIADQFRKKCYESGGEWRLREQATGTAGADDRPDPAGFDLERAWEEEWDKAVMEQSLQRARQNADPLQYQLFYLHVVKQVPAREVARQMKVKLPEVYFAKYKLSALVKREIRSLEEKMV